jgi:Glyoxalasedomain-containing protein 4-like, C-terminal domain
MSLCSERSLHWCLKISSLGDALAVLSKLGMSVQRHEEFDAGCDASCNGAYSRPWSKTMVGWAECNHFVLELTYNYGIKSYDVCDDLTEIGVDVDELDTMCAGLGAKIGDDGERQFCVELGAERYRLRVRERDAERRVGVDIAKLSLRVESIERARKFWVGTLGMSVVEGDNDNGKLVVSYDARAQVLLELVETGKPVDHGGKRGAYGRIAFSTRTPVKQWRERIVTGDCGGASVHTEPVTLSTPGKADVEVIILSCPDAYEVCLVGEQGFNDLSAFDPTPIDWAYRQERGGK